MPKNKHISIRLDKKNITILNKGPIKLTPSKELIKNVSDNYDKKRWSARLLKD